jgi:hypothetical protein
MPFGEELFLAMVVAVFTGYGILLAVLCWLDGRYDKQLQSTKQAGEQRQVGFGHPGALAGRHA